MTMIVSEISLTPCNNDFVLHIPAPVELATQPAELTMVGNV